MDLRTALGGVAGYSHSAGKMQSAQQNLVAVGRELRDGVPTGFKVRVSGNAQSLPLIPWIALLDPDVTKTAKEGLYLVYLYHSQIDMVFLSMNQGVTQHELRAQEEGFAGVKAQRAAIERLHEESVLIRQGIDRRLLEKLDTVIDLGSSEFLPAAYRAGNIAAVAYQLDALPSNDQLVHDLYRFGLLHAACIEAKTRLAAVNQVATTALSTAIGSHKPLQVMDFKPKDATDYRAQIAAATQTRSRKHEALIADFGAAISAAGGQPYTSVHPRDLIVRCDGEEWLIEAKTVGPAVHLAVRAAIGQLLEYSHFLYTEPQQAAVHLMALFSAPIGRAYEQLLDHLGIDFIVRENSGWTGSPAALQLLVDNRPVS